MKIRLPRKSSHKSAVWLRIWSRSAARAFTGCGRTWGQTDLSTGQAGIHADEERVPHDYIGLIERAMNAMLDIAEAGLPQNVAAENQAGLNFGRFQVIDDLPAVHAFAYRDGEAEWRGIRSRIEVW